MLHNFSINSNFHTAWDGKTLSLQLFTFVITVRRTTADKTSLMTVKTLTRGIYDAQIQQPTTQLYVELQIWDFYNMIHMEW